MSPEQRAVQNHYVASEQFKARMNKKEAKENPLDSQQRYETLLASLDDGKFSVLNCRGVNSMLAKDN